MIIASPTEPVPASGVVDTTPRTDGVPGLDDASGDASAFGCILRQQVGRDAGDDVPTIDVAAPADDVRQTGRSIPLAAPDPAQKKPSDPLPDPSTPDADKRLPDLQAAADLAAQLALVSQWAAVAQPSTDRAPAPDDGLDVAGKLQTVRTASRSTPGTPARPFGADDRASPVAAGRPSTGIDLPSVVGGTQAATSTVALSKAFDTAVEGAVRSRGEASAPQVAAVVGAVDAVALPSEATSPIGPLLQAGTSPSVVQAAQAAPAAGVLAQAVGTPAWSHEVGQATLRMAADDLRTASLQLNPDHLGPLDVQLRIEHGVAHLAFGAAHAETRQALEASRATLDQLFGAQGLQIGDCSVGDSTSTTRRFASDVGDGGARGDGGRWGRGGGDPAAPAPAPIVIAVRRPLGLVDTFA